MSATRSAATSRSWGLGNIEWKPSAVTAKVYMPSNAPKSRLIKVATNFSDDAGRLKPTIIDLQHEADDTILAVKQSLAEHPLFVGVPTDRMRITVYGAEAEDGQMVQDVSPTAREVACRLQVVRRGGAPPEEAEVEVVHEKKKGDFLKGMQSKYNLHGKKKKKPEEAKVEEEPEEEEIPELPPLGTLYLRSAVCGGRPEELHDLAAAMDVKNLREMVAKLPLAIRAWHDDPTAAEEGRKPREVVIKPGDEVPANQVLLLGQGIDLELDKDLAEEAGQAMVHLRDGKRLHQYGVKDGSMLYVVVEGPRPPVV